MLSGDFHFAEKRYSLCAWVLCPQPRADDHADSHAIDEYDAAKDRKANSQPPTLSHVD